jgi:hypothetical protein
MEDNMEAVYQILDIGFNAAVINLAKRTAGEFRVSADAPQTYEQLIRQIETQGIIAVWNGASEHTIFGDPEVNYAFRAWHDWCHWRGRHFFTPEGERAATLMQCDQLVTLYGDTPRTRYWHRIIEAEIIGQTSYREMYGEFPVDQYAFVVDYLANPANM